MNMFMYVINLVGLKISLNNVSNTDGKRFTVSLSVGNKLGN